VGGELHIEEADFAFQRDCSFRRSCQLQLLPPLKVTLD